MQQHGDSGGAVAAVLGGGRTAPGVEDFGADIGQLAAGDGDGAAAVIDRAAAVCGADAAQGTGAVVAQVIPAALRTVGDLQAARRRGGVDGHDVVVGACPRRYGYCCRIRHLQVLGSGAAVQRPAATKVFVNRDAPGGVIDGADVVAGTADDAAAVARINTANDQAQAAGEDGAPRIDHCPLVERQVAVNAVFLARGVKEDLLLASSGEIHQRRFDLTGGYQLFH